MPNLKIKKRQGILQAKGLYATKAETDFSLNVTVPATASTVL